MSSTELRWGGKVLNKSEQQFLNESLDKMLLKMAEISADIRQLTENIRQYIEATKEVKKNLDGLNEMLSGQRFIDLQKGLAVARFEMMKQMPVHYILKGEMKNKDIVKLMMEIAKQQMQQQTQTVPKIVLDVLRGKRSRSDFAVEMLKAMEKGEHHG